MSVTINNQPFQNINYDIDMNNYNLNINNNFVNNYKSPYQGYIPDPHVENKFFTETKMHFKDDVNSYQKMKEEKYKEILKTQKNTRFIQLYRKQINDNKNNLNLNTNNSKEEVFIDDYIKLVKEMYQDKNNYFNYRAQRGFYNFSQCPFCGDPAVFIFERVLCINKCFITSVANDTFNENYTLDNFMEQYKEYYSKHLNCGGDLMTLYVDNESKCAEFLCCKCEKNYINLNDE